MDIEKIGITLVQGIEMLGKEVQALQKALDAACTDLSFIANGEIRVEGCPMQQHNVTWGSCYECDQHASKWPDCYMRFYKEKGE